MLNVKKYKILGICCSKITNEDVKGIVDSICSSAVGSGWKVMIFSSFCDLYANTGESAGDIAGEAGIYRLVNIDLLDALVILPESIMNDEVSGKLVEAGVNAGIPVVTLDREFAGASCIRFDYVTTFEKILRHVIEVHGCRTINLMAGFRGNTFSEERLSCCRSIFREYGLELDERRIGYGDFWNVPTERAMDKFMETGLPLPQAIVCFNDSMAIAVCQYLFKRGIRVPEDVIVTGFDGIALEKYYQPRLTTGCVDYSSSGERVMALIAGERRGPVTEFIPYRMRLGQSCGCVELSAYEPCEKILQLYERVGNSAWHEDYMFSFLRKATKCGNLQELARVMGNHGDYVEWFCVNTDIFENVPGSLRYNELFTENVNCFMHRNRDDICTDSIIFPACRLLPDMEGVLENHDVLYFSPLHFMEKIIGYACADIAFADDFVYSNRRRYIGNVSQLLENLTNCVKLERANSELAEMHIHDPLTGLLNRRGFYKEFEKRNTGEKMYVFSIDMDRLKYINDNFGHTEGDCAIKTVATSLVYNGGNIACSRFGGDEFAVIAAGSDFDPKEYIAQVRGYLDEYNSRSGKPYPVRISVGWESSMTGAPVDIDEMIRTADSRMYEDKRQRKAVRMD